MTKAEARKADNLRKSQELRARFAARVAAQDPDDELTADPYWNPEHPDYNDDPGRPLPPMEAPGDNVIPMPLPSGNGTPRPKVPNPASAKQIAFLVKLLAESRMDDEPTIRSIRKAMDAGEEIDRGDAKEAIDWLLLAPRPNRYGGVCDLCDQYVGAGEGHIYKISGKWQARHRKDDCPEPAAVLEAVEDLPPVAADGLDLRVLPVGRNRYADPRWADNPEGDYSRLKVQVDVVADGKWAGWVFVKDAAEYGAGNKYGAARPEEAYVGDIEDELEAIVADPQKAMQAYGLLVGSCSRCNRQLEDETSISLGIGPVCRRKLSNDYGYEF